MEEAAHPLGESPVGLRSRALIDGIADLLRHCGLPPERQRLLRGADAVAQARLVDGLNAVLGALGIAGEAQAAGGEPWPLGPGQLQAALADPASATLEL